MGKIRITWNSIKRWHKISVILIFLVIGTSWVLLPFGVWNGVGVVLNRTAFFPVKEGGPAMITFVGLILIICTFIGMEE